MLKVVLIIDCDICGQPFNRIATSNCDDPLAWKALSQNLEDTAENCGWSSLRSAHYCEFCMSDVSLSLLRGNDPGF